LVLREGADLLVDDLAVVEEDQRRDGPDLEPPAHRRVVVRIDLDELELAAPSATAGTRFLVPQLVHLTVVDF
jgi:hypothetical protein